MSQNEVNDAAQLFERCGRSTVHFKRALNLAILQQISFREMSNQLVGYADGDTEALSLRMVQWELEQLDKLAQRHRFQYRAFLQRYWNVIYRVGTFSFNELLSWFPTQFLVADSSVAADRAYRRGLVQLVRLGFIATRKESDQEIFYLPPNQRVVMESLASDAEVPSSVPFRAPMANLSMALERVKKGEIESVLSILAIERDYSPYIAKPEVATAVLKAGMLRAELAGRSDKQQQIDILDELISRYGKREEPALVELVAQSLLNKGVLLGLLKRSDEEIFVYDELISRYGERKELALAELVSTALDYKGIALRELNHSDEAIVVYDLLISRYGEREELALAVQVADAHLSKGFALGQLERSAEEIKVYDDFIDRYQQRREFALELLVAKALFSKGSTLSRLKRSNEAIRAYNKLISRYDNRDELAFAEQVAKAMVNKGIMLASVARFDEAIVEFEKLTSRYSVRNELVLIDSVARAMFNKCATLAMQNLSVEALELLCEFESRFAGRSEIEIRRQLENVEPLRKLIQQPSVKQEGK